MKTPLLASALLRALDGTSLRVTLYVRHFINACRPICDPVVTGARIVVATTSY